MKYNILKSELIGIKNKIKNQGSQDYSMIFEGKCMYAIVVSDGHSNDFFEYSKYGAQIACKVFIESIKNNLQDVNELKNYIYDEWMKEVYYDFYTRNYRVFKVDYLKYSTTLVGVAIINQEMLVLKIGDGNIYIRENGKYKEILENNHKKVVDSLGRLESKEFIRIEKINTNETKLEQISIFTDGYENSFKTKNKLKYSLSEVYINFNKSIFSRVKTIKQYDENLVKLKGMDDISIIHLFKVI